MSKEAGPLPEQPRPVRLAEELREMIKKIQPERSGSEGAYSRRERLLPSDEPIFKLTYSTWPIGPDRRGRSAAFMLEAPTPDTHEVSTFHLTDDIEHNLTLNGVVAKTDEEWHLFENAVHGARIALGLEDENEA